MQLNALDPTGKPWNEAALHVLGASTIRCEPDGPVVDPEIDLSGYAAAVATLLRSSLVAYAEEKQQAIAQGGFTVNANASGEALNIHVATDPTYANYLSSAVQLAQLMASGALPQSSINWVQGTGTVALTPQQTILVGVSVAALVQQSFTTLGQIIAAIAAGTITAKAQIDTPPAPIPAWPENS